VLSKISSLFNFNGDDDHDGIPNRDDPDMNGDGIVDNSRVILSPKIDTDGDGISDINDPDIDGDGINNSNDPDVNGDGVMDNFFGIPPNGDIDNDGVPNINDSDMDGDGINNGNDPDIDNNGNNDQQINAESCNEIRIINNMSDSLFDLNFNDQDCVGFSTDICQQRGQGMTIYMWNQRFGCCVWDCFLRIEDIWPNLGNLDNLFGQTNPNSVCRQLKEDNRNTYGEYNPNINADECSIYAMEQCDQRGQQVVNISWFSQPKCCLWDCKNIDWDAIHRCENYAQTQGFSYSYYGDEVNNYTQCISYQAASCANLGMYPSNAGWISGHKCCEWNCKTAQEYCRGIASFGGYEFSYKDNQMDTYEECSSYATTQCQAIGKGKSRSYIVLSEKCCMWDCNMTQSSSSCMDYDSDLGYPAFLRTYAVCIDDFGTHSDSCNSKDKVVEWYCVGSAGQTYCSNTTYTCSSYFGTGSSCSEGSCT